MGRFAYSNGMSHTLRSWTAILSLAACFSIQAAEPPPLPAQPPLATASIRTTQDTPGGVWHIEGRRLRVDVDPSDLSCRVTAPGASWRMEPSHAGDLKVRVDGKSHTLQLASAARKVVSPYGTGFRSGVKMELSGLKVGESKIDLSIQLILCLEGLEEDLVATLIATDGSSRVE